MDGTLHIAHILNPLWHVGGGNTFIPLLYLDYAGLLMGDDIETGRSMDSNYWAALLWLSKNQNNLP